MALKIIPPHTDWRTNHVPRRIYCDGCGLSMNISPERWVYDEAQVAQWFEEHKDCAGGYHSSEIQLQRAAMKALPAAPAPATEAKP